MPITGPFDAYADQYEQWFSNFKPVYDTEVEALQIVLPRSSVEKSGPPVGLEIGAGSGLFASRLGVQYGIEPSQVMLHKAEARGIQMKQGTAEKLPYENSCFDYTLMVTAICFLDDMNQAITEMMRVIKPGGSALFGFVDKDSPLGKEYQAHKDEGLFYAPATFRSAREVIKALQEQRFSVEVVRQTVFGNIKHITTTQSTKTGHGEGGFVVIKALKPEE